MASKHRKILLAEDNADHQQVLLRALTRDRDYIQMTVVSNGQQLLAAAQQEAFDCILIDFNLDQCSAPDVIPRLNQLQDRVPKIVLSASDDQRIVVESMRCGVSDFLNKVEAIEPGVLWRRVEKAIDEAEHQQRERRKANRRLRMLRKEAELDALTGLYNRRFTERFLSKDRRGQDRRANACVVMIDLDNFKTINDTLGHDAGDSAIRQAARIIREHTQPNDIAARWGGEEFLVIRYAPSLTDSWIWADELRRKIKDKIVLPAPANGLTASIGVDFIPTSDLCEETISRADRAMYHAKDHGRDRVSTWAMAVTASEAMTIQSYPNQTPRSRLLMLRDRLHDSLGETQLDHTGLHGHRVRQMVERIASPLITDPAIAEDLALAAEFHDIGKLGIPEELLALPRGLTDGERRLINEHGRFGSELLEICGASERAVRAVARHHESFVDAVTTSISTNRSPSLGGIIGVCDAVVTMLSGRPYAQAKTPVEVITELKEHRGEQFDPIIVDAIRLFNHQMPLAA
ncbi:diguanylate cyclase [Mucisphaera calidilacus]|uniref:diguanylate cyclase n=1 Tax=Mucisphaera calidilacus TaxID=2527982 RepID=A0A518BU46_9BACT|nr:diguanylate cyclase [Mucisphaera calidilacus]QDU70510.1 Response regulator PleD [Mucisphaera calidilacus]